MGVWKEGKEIYRSIIFFVQSENGELIWDLGSPLKLKFLTAKENRRLWIIIRTMRGWIEADRDGTEIYTEIRELKNM